MGRFHLIRINSGLGILLVALAAAGCDNGTTAPAAGSLTAAEAVMLATEIDRSSDAMVNGTIDGRNGAGTMAESSSTRTIEIKFAGKSSCPRGGEVIVEGQMAWEHNLDERSTSVTVQATRTMDDCAYTGEKGEVTIDGEISLAADRYRVVGWPSGPQTTTHTGTITWTRESGESMTCKIEITSVRDPETKKWTLTGTVCGHLVSRTVTWGAGA